MAALASKHGVESEKHIVEGRRPALTILWVAEEVGADYIVMGAEGMSRLESLMIGGVAQEVLRNAKRTVLLVGGQRSPAIRCSPSRYARSLGPKTSRAKNPR